MYKATNEGYKACTGCLSNLVRNPTISFAKFKRSCLAVGVVWVCVMHHKANHDALDNALLQ